MASFYRWPGVYIAMLSSGFGLGPAARRPMKCPTSPPTIVFLAATLNMLGLRVRQEERQVMPFPPPFISTRISGERQVD